MPGLRHLQAWRSILNQGFAEILGLMRLGQFTGAIVFAGDHIGGKADTSQQCKFPEAEEEASSQYL